jgi:hypothetical protein
MNDLVSIITPTFNSADFIQETIHSVQKQTYQNWEMLITDDCSTDQTFDIIQAYAKKDQRIKLFKLAKHSGPAVARNNSIGLAKGRFIAFLDADDLWLPGKLELQIQIIDNNKADICYGSYMIIDENSRSLNIKVNAITNLSFKKLLKNNYIGNLTGIYDADKLGKIYNPCIKKRQDWGLWLIALKKSRSNSIGLDQTIAKYRVHRNSISRNKLNLLKHNFTVYHKCLNFSYIKSLFFMVLFLYEYFFVRPKFISKVEDS